MDKYESLSTLRLRALARGGMSLNRDTLDDQMSVTSKTSNCSSVLDRGALVEAYKEKKKYFSHPNSIEHSPVKLVRPGKHQKRLPKVPMATKKRKMRERLQAMQNRTNVERWWENKPSVAGEACNPIQENLAQPDTYTGVYRRRFQPSNLTAVSGDYCPSPIAAQTMLKSRSYQQLTLPARAADFTAEVNWRLGLRPQSKASTIRRRLGHPGAGL